MHLSRDKNFVPDASTLATVVEGLNQAAISGLVPESSYFVKVAQRVGSKLYFDETSLLVKTQREALTIANGISVLTEQTGGYTVLEIRSDTLLIAREAAAASIRVGSVMAGTDPKNTGTAYLRRVTAIQSIGSQVSVSTESVELFDVFDTGDLEITLPVASILASELAAEPVSPRVSKLALKKPQASGDIECTSSAVNSWIVPTVGRPRYSPNPIRVVFNFNKDTGPRLSLHLIGNASLPIDLNVSGSAALEGSCDLEILNSRVSSAIIPIPIGIILLPLEISVKAMITGEFGGKVGKNGIQMKFPLLASGEFDYALTIDKASGVSPSGTSDFRIRQRPGAEASFSDETEIEVFAGVRFGMGIGLYGASIIEYGVKTDGGVHVTTTSPTDEFLSAIAKTYVSAASVSTGASWYAQINFNQRLREFFSIGVGFQIDSPIGDDSIALRLPKNTIGFSVEGPTTASVFGLESDGIETPPIFETLKWYSSSDKARIFPTNKFEARIVDGDQGCVKVAYTVEHEGFTWLGPQMSPISRPLAPTIDILSQGLQTSATTIEAGHVIFTRDDHGVLLRNREVPVLLRSDGRGIQDVLTPQEFRIVSKDGCNLQLVEFLLSVDTWDRDASPGIPEFDYAAIRVEGYVVDNSGLLVLQKVADFRFPSTLSQKNSVGLWSFSNTESLRIGPLNWEPMNEIRIKIALTCGGAGPDRIAAANSFGMGSLTCYWGLGNAGFLDVFPKVVSAVIR